MTQLYDEDLNDGIAPNAKYTKEIEKLVNYLYCSNLEDPPMNSRWVLNSQAASTESCTVDPSILFPIRKSPARLLQGTKPETGVYPADYAQCGDVGPSSDPEEEGDGIEESLSIYYDNYKQQFHTPPPRQVKWGKVPVLKTHSEIFLEKTGSDSEED